MEGHCSTGQSPQWAVVPLEEEEKEKDVWLYYIYIYFYIILYFSLYSRQLGCPTSKLSLQFWLQILSYIWMHNFTYDYLKDNICFNISLKMVKVLGWKSYYIYLYTNKYCYLFQVLRQYMFLGGYIKGKSVPLQACSGPERSRKLRFPDFVTMAQDGGRVVSLTHRPLLPPGNAPGTHFC